jgi:hypothetical protein
MTTLWRWLGRWAAGRPVPADEFRADRMDAGWRPEYRAIAGRDQPMPALMPYQFHP